jgi:hypothetical protein
MPAPVFPEEPQTQPECERAKFTFHLSELLQAFARAELKTHVNCTLVQIKIARGSAGKLSLGLQATKLSNFGKFLRPDKVVIQICHTLPYPLKAQ